MKAISLWQPYATAMAILLKQIETRSWKTSYRGPMAICATKAFPKEAQRFAQVEVALGRLPSRLPLGVIVAVGNLTDIKRTEEVASLITPIERLYGNYDPHRYAWFFKDMKALKEPIPCRCGRTIFEIPDALLEGCL